MEFSSLFFLYFFLPIFIILFFILKREVHNLFLLITSLIFYTWGEGQYTLLLLCSVIINYFIGRFLDQTKSKLGNILFYILALSINLGILIYFKYTYFILNNIGISFNVKSVYLPLGISFYTFQSISFITDIYRKTVKMDKKFLNFALYMTFFPKLITGPITPYNDLQKQIGNHRKISPDDISEGIKRLVLGLGKKVLIADTLAITANSIFSIPAQDQTFTLSWIGALFYSLQIYFDFSGYTDMAIGVGRICGFKLLENFNYPYIAKSIKEFWRRWHISLANWLRDYLFLPIAYSISRKIRRKFLGIKADNLTYFISAFITFLLCGIWHGANWTFIVWGGYYGVLLIIEHAGLGKKMKRFKWQIIPLLYTQLLVIVGWVIFRSESLSYAFSYLKAMSGFGTGKNLLYYPSLYLNSESMFFLIIGIIGSTPVLMNFSKLIKDRVSRSGRLDNSLIFQKFMFSTYYFAYNLYLISILFFITINLVGGTYNPFIYARF